jgi:hypothetical protein
MTWAASVWQGRGMLIPARFNGPPGSGNGGWSAGVFAAAAGARVGGDVCEVTLRVPPPLETPFELADGEVRAPDGTVVAQVRAVDGVGPAVDGVSATDALAASAAYPGMVDHPFPGCYVCGPDRAVGDGLRIFPGPVGDGRTAAPWTVPADVSFETVWAALDCPGGWAVLGQGRVYVLGRIAAAVDALPAPGATCVVVGAGVASQGRKADVRSTVYGPDGRPLATARATWIAIG